MERVPLLHICWRAPTCQRECYRDTTVTSQLRVPDALRCRAFRCAAGIETSPLKCSVSWRLCHLFPENGLLTFQQTTIFRPGIRRLSVHPFESEPALGIDRIPLFGPRPFDQDDISLPEPLQFFITP